MHKLELFDETFDPNRTESYELSIQVSLDGFSFCVKDLTRNYFIVLVSSPFELGISSTDDWSNQVDFIKNNFPWISKPFKKVHFSYESQAYTLVPKEFFEAEKAKSFLTFAHNIGEFDEIWFNQMHSEYVSVFSIPSLLISSWLKVQASTKVIALCDPLLFYHNISHHKRDVNTATLLFSKGFTTLLLSAEDKLLHCGSMVIQTPDDIVYHVSNICKQFNLKTSEVKVNILGNYNFPEQLESLVSRFFKKSETISTLENVHFSYLLNKHKVKFANLFNQSLCV